MPREAGGRMELHAANGWSWTYPRLRQSWREGASKRVGLLINISIYHSYLQPWGPFGRNTIGSPNCHGDKHTHQSSNGQNGMQSGNWGISGQGLIRMRMMKQTSSRNCMKSPRLRLLDRIHFRVSALILWALHGSAPSYPRDQLFPHSHALHGSYKPPEEWSYRPGEGM